MSSHHHYSTTSNEYPNDKKVLHTLKTAHALCAFLRTNNNNNNNQNPIQHHHHVNDDDDYDDPTVRGREDFGDFLLLAQQQQQQQQQKQEEEDDFDLEQQQQQQQQSSSEYLLSAREIMHKMQNKKILSPGFLDSSSSSEEESDDNSDDDFLSFQPYCNPAALLINTSNKKRTISASPQPAVSVPRSESVGTNTEDVQTETTTDEDNNSTTTYKLYQERIQQSEERARNAERRVTHLERAETEAGDKILKLEEQMSIIGKDYEHAKEKMKMEQEMQKERDELLERIRELEKIVESKFETTVKKQESLLNETLENKKSEIIKQQQLFSNASESEQISILRKEVEELTSKSKNKIHAETENCNIDLLPRFTSCQEIQTEIVIIEAEEDANNSRSIELYQQKESEQRSIITTESLEFLSFVHDIQPQQQEQLIVSSTTRKKFVSSSRQELQTVTNLFALEVLSHQESKQRMKLQEEISDSEKQLLTTISTSSSSLSILQQQNKNKTEVEKQKIILDKQKQETELLRQLFVSENFFLKESLQRRKIVSQESVEWVSGITVSLATECISSKKDIQQLLQQQLEENKKREVEMKQNETTRERSMKQQQEESAMLKKLFAHENFFAKETRLRNKILSEESATLLTMLIASNTSVVKSISERCNNDDQSIRSLQELMEKEKIISMKEIKKQQKESETLRFYFLQESLVGREAKKRNEILLDEVEAAWMLSTIIHCQEQQELEQHHQLQRTIEAEQNAAASEEQKQDYEESSLILRNLYTIQTMCLTEVSSRAKILEEESQQRLLVAGFIHMMLTHWRLKQQATEFNQTQTHNAATTSMMISTKMELFVLESAAVGSLSLATVIEQEEVTERLQLVEWFYQQHLRHTVSEMEREYLCWAESEVAEHEQRLSEELTSESQRRERGLRHDNKEKVKGLMEQFSKKKQELKEENTLLRNLFLTESLVKQERESRFLIEKEEMETVLKITLELSQNEKQEQQREFEEKLNELLLNATSSSSTSSQIIAPTSELSSPTEKEQQHQDDDDEEEEEVFDHFEFLRLTKQKIVNSSLFSSSETQRKKNMELQTQFVAESLLHKESCIRTSIEMEQQSDRLAFGREFHVAAKSKLMLTLSSPSAENTTAASKQEEQATEQQQQTVIFDTFFKQQDRLREFIVKREDSVRHDQLAMEMLQLTLHRLDTELNSKNQELEKHHSNSRDMSDALRQRISELEDQSRIESQQQQQQHDRTVAAITAEFQDAVNSLTEEKLFLQNTFTTEVLTRCETEKRMRIENELVQQNRDELLKELMLKVFTTTMTPSVPVEVAPNRSTSTTSLKPSVVSRSASAAIFTSENDNQQQQNQQQTRTLEMNEQEDRQNIFLDETEAIFDDIILPLQQQQYLATSRQQQQEHQQQLEQVSQQNESQLETVQQQKVALEMELEDANIRLDQLQQQLQQQQLSSSSPQSPSKSQTREEEADDRNNKSRQQLLEETIATLKQQLQDSENAKQQQSSLLEGELSDMKKHQQQQKEIHQNLLDENTALKNQLQKQQQESSAKMSESLLLVQQKQRELQQLKEQATTQQEQRSTAIIISDLQQQLTESQHSLKSKEFESKRLKSDNEELTRRLQDRVEEVQALESRLAALREDRAYESSARVESLHGKGGEIFRMIQETQSEAERLKQQKGQDDATIEELTTENRLLKDRLLSMKLQLHELMQQKQKSDNNNDDDQQQQQPQVVQTAVARTPSSSSSNNNNNSVVPLPRRPFTPVPTMDLSTQMNTWYQQLSRSSSTS